MTHYILTLVCQTKEIGITECGQSQKILFFKMIVGEYLAFCGGGKRKYSFKNDTLTMHAVSAPELETCVRCYLKSENTKHDKSIHIGKRYNVEKAQFLVLKSTKNVLQVVYLHTYQPINDTIDSDIELR